VIEMCKSSVRRKKGLSPSSVPLVPALPGWARRRHSRIRPSLGATALRELVLGENAALMT
jgi:hypothetical protein